MSTKEPLTREDLREELQLLERATDAHFESLAEKVQSIFRDEFRKALDTPFGTCPAFADLQLPLVSRTAVDGLEPEEQSGAPGVDTKLCTDSCVTSGLRVSAAAKEPRRSGGREPKTGVHQATWGELVRERDAVPGSRKSMAMISQGSSCNRQKEVLQSSANDRGKVATFMGWLQFVSFAIVTDWKFDCIIGLLIFANSGLIGWTTDYLARRETDILPLWVKFLDNTFASVFGLELVLRMLALRKGFFVGQDYRWNLFDIVVFTSQIMESVTQEVMAGISSIARMLRVLRLTRVVRIVRVIRLIGELRAIISSIVGSIRHVFWTIVLLFLLIYTFSIFLLQVVSNHKLQLLDEGASLESITLLDTLFPNLYEVILLVYQSISGGVDWSQVTGQLQEAGLSASIVVLYVMYVAFVMFAIMNSVTGVFVEIATKRAKQDQDEFLCTLACRVLEQAGIEQGGAIDWEDFQYCVGCRDMEMYLEAIDVKYEDAAMLFHLLDSDRSGLITSTEFVDGCIRLSGSCKAIDFAAFRTDQLSKWDRMQEELDALKEGIRTGNHLMMSVAHWCRNGSPAGSPTPPTDAVPARPPGQLQPVCVEAGMPLVGTHDDKVGGGELCGVTTAQPPAIRSQEGAEQWGATSTSSMKFPSNTNSSNKTIAGTLEMVARQQDEPGAAVGLEDGFASELKNALPSTMAL